MIHFKDNKNKSALSTRWAQMSKQEQIIERKKIEIQAKLEAQKQAAALAAQAKLSNPSPIDDKGSSNIFSNDGSFMSNFKALLEKQQQEKKEKEDKEKDKLAEEIKKSKIEQKAKVKQEEHTSISDNRDTHQEHAENDDRRRSNDKGSRNRRWSDRGRNRAHSPMTPAVEDRRKPVDNKNIPPLMQLSVVPPDDPNSDSDSHQQWNIASGDGPDLKDDSDNSDQGSMMGPGPMGSGMLGPGPMGPGMIGPGPMGPGMMGPGSMGPMGPGPMGPGPMGQMGPGPSGPGPMGHGPMGPMGPGPMGLGPMGPGPMGSGPMGSGPMGSGPMGPGPMGPGPMGSGPMMRPGGPMPPFMGGPPNFAMPPNFMGPNGPGPMPPNMCGPNMRGPGPNGPMPPFFGPPFPNPSMMGPNGPRNSMMPPNPGNNMSFMPRPPFGPNGPNFGPNGNGLPNMPQPGLPNSMNPNPIHKISDRENVIVPPPEQMKLQNIPPPMPLTLNHIPKPKDLDPGNIPAPPQMSQVLSSDMFPPSVRRAATEVASNGDHWESVLKAIHSQDQNMWFLHNQNSNEYKMFRELVIKLRNDQEEKRVEVKPEDKYEPEFSLEDDDSEDSRPNVKEESRDDYSNSDSQFHYNQNAFHDAFKREQASSQSDEESDSKRDARRRKRKSRWGEDPPSEDVKPPGMMMPGMPMMPQMMSQMPHMMPHMMQQMMPPGIAPPMPTGPKLAKIDEDGLKLSAMNRSNQALMQYALTNYGTTNLSVEDWKKCEDNFKLNLLYQDMLKKRQQVERLEAAGKHKYEYDSDEDTAEGTWEHKLRSKEMNATEKWADELTKQAAGKHHIGDFLPPEELRKFMEKYSAFKSGKEPDLSDYKEFKLKEDNLGFKMLQKLGWNEGQGLGVEGTGIVEPINKAQQPVANMGLGANGSDAASPDDDEFDAYRKRMMLAYRFRPNPLNNPRRPYY